MNIENRILEYIEKQINDVDLNKLYEQVENEFIIDKWILISLVEALYYREIIINNETCERLIMNLNILRDPEAKLTQLTYLYIIYDCEKIIKMELLHDLEYYSKWDIRGIASEEKMDFFNMMNEEEESRQKITKMELLFKSGICYDLSKLIISYI